MSDDINQITSSTEELYISVIMSIYSRTYAESLDKKEIREIDADAT